MFFEPKFSTHYNIFQPNLVILLLLKRVFLEISFVFTILKISLECNLSVFNGKQQLPLTMPLKRPKENKIIGSNFFSTDCLPNLIDSA